MKRLTFMPEYIVLRILSDNASEEWRWLVADDGRAEFDTSIVASMEVNGIVYQGVLFAQPPTPNVVGGARI